MEPYEPPTYVTSGAPYLGAVHLCSQCGALTTKPVAHSEWHAHLDGVMKGLAAKAERGDRAAAMMTPIGRRI